MCLLMVGAGRMCVECKSEYNVLKEFSKVILKIKIISNKLIIKLVIK